MPEKRGTIPDLVELTSLGDDVTKPEQTALKYLNALVACGVVMKLRNRAQGFAPSSNGFLRWAVINDVGPLAPRMCKQGLINPNANNEIIAPVAKKEAA